MPSARTLSLTVFLLALPFAPASAQTSGNAVVGLPRVSVVGQGGTTQPPAPSSASRDPRAVPLPGRYRPYRPQLNACRRSRPAFGDADFTFHGFDDAHIPC